MDRVIEVNISPYLRNLDKTSLIAAFRIDRKASTCVTPVRNPEINMMVSQFQELGNFCDQISAVLQSKYTHSKQRNYFMSLSGSEGMKSSNLQRMLFLLVAFHSIYSDRSVIESL